MRLARSPTSRELPLDVTMAVGMPANERMDALVEKACELGVAAIQPLVCERSVLRLTGERAQKKVAHWQSGGGRGLRAERPHARAGGRPGAQSAEWLAGCPPPRRTNIGWC